MTRALDFLGIYYYGARQKGVWNLKSKVFSILALLVFVNMTLGEKLVSPRLPENWRVEVKTVTHLVGPEKQFAMVGSLTVSHPTNFETWFEYGPTSGLGSRTDRITYRGFTGEQLISQAFPVRPGAKIYYRFVAQVEKEVTPPFYGEVKEVDPSKETKIKESTEELNKIHEVGRQQGVGHVMLVIDEQGGKAMPLDDLPNGDYKVLGGVNLSDRPVAYFILRNQASNKDYLVCAQRAADREALMSPGLGGLVRMQKTIRLEILPISNP